MLKALWTAFPQQPRGSLLVAPLLDEHVQDLALLIGPDQKWLTTTQFLDKLDANLKIAMK